MAKTANLYARIEPELKEQAESIRAALGIPDSNAITGQLNRLDETIIVWIVWKHISRKACRQISTNAENDRDALHQIKLERNQP